MVVAQEQAIGRWLASGLDDYLGAFVLLDLCAIDADNAGASEQEAFLTALRVVLERGWLEEVRLQGGAVRTDRTPDEVVSHIRSEWSSGSMDWRWGLWFQITDLGESEARIRASETTPPLG